MQSMPKRIEEMAMRIKHLEDVEKHLKERANALTREANELAHERQALRDEIQGMMEFNDLTKMKGQHFIIDYVNCAEKIKIADASLIPAKYKKVEVKLNKRAILADKDSGPIPGIKFTSSKTIIIKAI